MLAYSPSTKHLVIAECKVQGPRNKVYPYTHDTGYEFIDSSFLYFLENLPVVLRDGGGFDRLVESFERVTVQLVSNTVVLRTCSTMRVGALPGTSRRRSSPRTKRG